MLTFIKYLDSIWINKKELSLELDNNNNQSKICSFNDFYIFFLL